jgi:hypothetical protein
MISEAVCLVVLSLVVKKTIVFHSKKSKIGIDSFDDKGLWVMLGNWFVSCSFLLCKVATMYWYSMLSVSL